MLELRKRDEDTLGAILRTHTVVPRQGALKVVTDAGDILKLVAAGELFGPELSLLDSADGYKAKALMPDLTICALPHVAFDKLMLERRALNGMVLRSLAQQAMRARHSFHWAKKSLRERAILTLHRLRTRFGVRYGQFRMIDLPLTKIDLASLMSTVQESAVRVLSEFREDGLISSNGKRIVILDNDRLDRLHDEILRKDRESATADESAAKDGPRPRN